MPGEIRVVTEPVAPWQPLGCIACLRPAEFQETAFADDQELPVHVRHCGDTKCKAYANGQAKEIGLYLEAEQATFH